MNPLTTANTNVLAHRIAGDSLMYECPNCEFGEIPVVSLVEQSDAGCLDCGVRYRLWATEVADDT